MLAVAITIATLLALIVGLLAVPVLFVVDAERVDTWNARWRVCWLFGLVNVRSTKRLHASPAPTRGKGGARSPTRGKRRAQTSTVDRARGRRVGLAALRTRGLGRRLVQLATTLLRQVKVERFHVDTAFGFENPADTGFVYGCLSPLLMLADARGMDIHCRPMFMECGVRGVLGATIHIRPLSMVGTIVAFLVSPPVVRAMGAAWRARR